MTTTETARSDLPIVIVGAGLVGSLSALFLARRGHTVRLFEKRPDSRKPTSQLSQSELRSINLALSHRGLSALDQVGCKDMLMAIGCPMPGRIIHNRTNQTPDFQPYGTDPSTHFIMSVSRRKLNEVLLDKLESDFGPDRVSIRFQCKCVGVDPFKGEAKFIDQSVRSTKNPQESTFSLTAKLVIGGDGAFSIVRQSIQNLGTFDFRQFYISHGYKELLIPPLPSGEWAMDPRGLHIWPRRDFMLIALPNPERNFTATLFLPLEGSQTSFKALNSREAVTEFFSREFPDAMSLMPTLLDDFFNNPSPGLVTVKCSPWNFKDKVMLIGDAAHAVVPFYGQGCNAGFEDCSVFDKILEKHNDDLGVAVREFSTTRSVDTNAIADLALENFIEMRDLTARRSYRIRHSFELLLHQLMPRIFAPLYPMIAFSSMPYSQARLRAQRQRKVLDLSFFMIGVAIAGIIGKFVFTKLRAG